MGGMNEKGGGRQKINIRGGPGQKSGEVGSRGNLMRVVRAERGEEEEEFKYVEEKRKEAAGNNNLWECGQIKT